MEKFSIVVPAGIRYISDWSKLEGGYNLEQYAFPHILDKQITGCGFTEYCLRNDMDIILCSPRKILLENKENQHPGEVFYFRNDLGESDKFDKDLVNLRKSPKRAASVMGNYIQQLKKDQQDKLLQQQINQQLNIKHAELKTYIGKMRSEHKPVKILVTYDSFRIVKDLLVMINALQDFHIVVDEWQAIFTDSRFKSDTELELLYALRDIQKVCYVSATPMMDKYLARLDEFKNLPFFEMDWISKDVLRVKRPNIDARGVNRLNETAGNIIKAYRSGKFEKAAYKDSITGNILEIESKEAVFYVNSVKNICDIIKREKLTPEECNILCAKSPDNLRKVKAAFKAACGARINELGTIPMLGEPHKMFTFCTRTVYLGADFYSTNARTFIFSDANVDSLAVDITQDLPQILGRQRLSINPWKDMANLYFKASEGIDQYTREDFDIIVQRKIEKSAELLQAIDAIGNRQNLVQAVAEKYKYCAETQNYKEDYVAVNAHGGSMLVPTFNKLVHVADERAFDIQLIDYKDRFSVFNAISSSRDIELNSLSLVVSEELHKFNSLTQFSDQLKYICEASYRLEEPQFNLLLDQTPIRIKNYYITLGPERCKASTYSLYRCEAEYEKILNNQSLSPKESILKTFEVGNRYTLKEIKEKLTEIYETVGYKKTAKASDLEEYFEVRVTKVISKDASKREKAYVILSIKQ